MAKSDNPVNPDNSNALEAELRRLVIRLTYGINEYDRPLMDLLAEIRAALSETVPARQLEDYYTRLGQWLGEDARKTAEQLILELPVTVFEKLLKSPRIPGKQRRQLLELVEQVIRHKGTLDPEIWYRFVDTLEQTIDNNDDDGSVLSSAKDYRHIEESLIRLLELVAIPETERSALNKLKGRLQTGGLDAEQLLELVHSVARLIERYHLEDAQQRESVESFLVEMKQNLQDMQRLVKSLLQDQSDNLKINSSFGRTLQKNILAMQQQFDSAHDLETLKRDIKTSMTQISTTLEQFTNSASSRQAKIHEEMQQVNARMNALEIVSEVLKQRLLNERKLAMIDPLTGVHNRMAYDQRIVEELERFERYKTPFVLSVWDLDRFKDINDHFGHQAGDRVLHALAEILSGSVRRVDFVARYGGEEFVIIIPNTTISGAMNLAEKIRLQVEKMRFHHNGQQVDVTISSGLAEAHSEDTVESLFRRADEALYRAKKNGRNRCETAV